jgi:hypothetical protein
MMQYVKSRIDTEFIIDNLLSSKGYNILCDNLYSNWINEQKLYLTQDFVGNAETYSCEVGFASWTLLTNETFILQIQNLLPEHINLDPKAVLDLIKEFASTWVSLNAYDKESLTIKGATKRKVNLASNDLVSAISNLRDELISIADERVSSYHTKNPYNINVGDQVFIQAHGRLRKGKIVSTTGSRFIVGYLTPSNHSDLKYKTLRLDNLWLPVNP